MQRPQKITLGEMRQKIRPQRGWGWGRKGYASQVPRKKQGSAHPLNNKWQITSYLLFWVSNRIFWGAPSGAFVAPYPDDGRRRFPGRLGIGEEVRYKLVCQPQDNQRVLGLLGKLRGQSAV